MSLKIEDLLTRAEAVRCLGISRVKLDFIAATGQVPVYRTAGGTVLLRRQDLVRWQARQPARKPDVDWGTVDWSKPTWQLAKDLERSPARISAQRRKYAPHTVARKPVVANWSKVDWSKSTWQLAEDLGVSGPYVAAQRRTYAPQTIRRRINWESVDLTRPTRELARELKVTYATIYIARKRRGISSGPRTWSKVDWAKVNWSLPTSRLAKMYGVTVSTVSGCRRRYAPETVRRRSSRKHANQRATK